MTQTTKRVPGRPPQSPTQQHAPVKKATPKVKRVLPDENKIPQVYQTVGNKGGIFFKLRSKNVTVFDEDANTVRQIRYCPGEPSVFVDEQSGLAKVEHVVFENKTLVIPFDKPNLRAFMELHPDNRANGGSLFELANKEADSEAELENEFAVTDAITMIKSRSIDELLPIALALNINTNQKDLAVKRALVLQAKSNPQRFMGLFDSPLVMARTTVTQAFDFQIIGDKEGAVVWFDTGKLIISVPVGQDKVEVMTRFVLTDKGSTVLSELERQLNDIA
jgi:hypothetical protein